MGLFGGHRKGSGIAGNLTVLEWARWCVWCAVLASGQCVCVSGGAAVVVVSVAMCRMSACKVG